MKLDATVMRTMGKTDFHILRAVETGMRNHALVPRNLIASIANLRHGGCHKVLSSLLRDKLLSHDQSCGYDGYRLTNSGYDILALHSLKTRGLIGALGDRIGTGKESDIYIAATPEGKQIVLKFHRLGRTSFRDVKKKRDYFMMNAMKKGKNGGGDLPNSWLFLSKISALKEYTFMKALHSVGYLTPDPIGQNRHIVVMSLVRGIPLYQLSASRVSPLQAECIFLQSMSLAKRLCFHGLVHCDLNEFNIMVDMSGGVQSHASEDNDVATHYVRHTGLPVDDDERGLLSAHNPTLATLVKDGTGEIVTEEAPKPIEILPDGEPKPIVTLIDFPQMVSYRHPNAEELFYRDVECLKRFFTKKLKCSPENEDDWEDLVPSWDKMMARMNEEPNGNDVDGVDENEEGDNKGKKKKEYVIASKIQQRLDEELQASGYSEDDSKRDMELYFFESSHYDIESKEKEDDVAVTDKSENENEDESDNDSDQSNSNKDKSGKLTSENNSSTQNKKNNILNLDELDYEERWRLAEAKAKERVQRHITDTKQANRRRGAFKSKNSNKTYVKGKRVMQDLSY